jgi:dTDP-L-rhamnose 4-epimerase
MVGVGQSQYQVRKYTEVNVGGTANLLDILVNSPNKVRKLVVASSMSAYGEGAYQCQQCGTVEVKLRKEGEMKEGDWEVPCPKCGRTTEPHPTKEIKPLECNSIYALTKKAQEEMTLNIGMTYDIPAVALRFFNVFGPRQSLSNPYTGVVAIFMSRVKNGNPPVVYEDGLQSRDFVSVHDIVEANLLAMDKREADYNVFNVGSGKPASIRQIAEIVIKLYGSRINPVVTHKFRKGDVRHCFSDISKIKEKLGFVPKVSLEEGMLELKKWSEGIHAEDKFEEAARELETRKLV